MNKNILLNGTLTVTEIGSTVANGRFTILTTNGTINGNFLTTRCAFRLFRAGQNK